MSDQMLPADIEELLNGPALAPPPGVIPDFENPGGTHSLGYTVVILGGVLSTIAVLLRLFSRFLIRKFQVEDGFLICAYGLFAGFLYPIYGGAITPGVLVHQWNVQLRSLESFLYRVHIGSIFYGLCIMFLKMAILLDWMRIFLPPGQRNAMYWMFQFLIWSAVIYFVSGSFLELFRCWPREKIWNPLFEGGHCYVDIDANNLASAIINLLSDIGILALPQRIIWALHMSRPRKIGISLLFTFGIFAAACGIARLVVLIKITQSEDAVYYVPSLSLWGIGEITAGFLVIGIPATPKVMHSIPVADSVVSLIRSWTGRSIPSDRHTSFIPGSEPPRQKVPGPWDDSALDTYQLVSVDVTTPPENHPVNGITRDLTVEVTRERVFHKGSMDSIDVRP